jgi:Arc/MetJ family transcription regulator
MRTPKSLTFDDSLLAEVERTKGPRSTSQRVNELLRRALLQERYEQLEREAEQFFHRPKAQALQEAQAFRKASIPSITRD